VSEEMSRSGACGEGVSMIESIDIGTLDSLEVEFSAWAPGVCWSCTDNRPSAEAGLCTYACRGVGAWVGVAASGFFKMFDRSGEVNLRVDDPCPPSVSNPVVIGAAWNAGSDEAVPSWGSEDTSSVIWLGLVFCVGLVPASSLIGDKIGVLTGGDGPVCILSLRRAAECAPEKSANESGGSTTVACDDLLVWLLALKTEAS
jgi:hypothetical protein